ncbi:MAG TPA: TIGR04255 family protein [Desulfobacterales bacterium]|nr:TIGR04255 family protein [Desulfobacterales bacterium]
MPFREAKRVLYKKNPLDRVICQLRFPPILRIDAEIPAQFQERVRRQFPNFSEASEWKVQVPQALEGQIPPEVLRQFVQSSGNKNYEFSSEDGVWQINLTRTFVALATKKYERWEEFKEKLQIPLEALSDVYSPDFFSRIGLRYTDIIKRSALGLDDVEWSQLLRPYILGILASPEVSDHVREFENRYEVGLSDGESVVRIVTTLIQPPDGDEICFMIDSDFYNSQKTEIDSAMERLNYFNVRASRLIQWCITERLHKAMEPQVL